jgi:crossover junction endodeoxyribonuclease RusA
MPAMGALQGLAEDVLEGEMMKLWVPGIPRSKGSMKSFWNKKAKRAVILGANPETEAWQSRVTQSAKDAGLTISSLPVSIDVEFFFTRPKYHWNSKGHLRESAPYEHAGKPDADKLLRAVLDALTSIAYVDDSQVCAVRVVKRWLNDPTHQPGAAIAIEQLSHSLTYPTAKPATPLTLFDDPESGKRPPKISESL